MSSLKKQLQEICESFQRKNPNGGTIYIGGNSTYNTEALDALESFIGVVSSVKMVRLKNRSNEDILVEIEALPKIEFSYDGGKTWS